MVQRYDKGLRLREFSARDLVLHRALGNARDTSAEKLALNWRGAWGRFSGVLDGFRCVPWPFASMRS